MGFILALGKFLLKSQYREKHENYPPRKNFHVYSNYQTLHFMFVYRID